ncbi:MAG: cadmium-translocating P-type ATPase [Cellulomonadaceae bacterium]|jgi:heavy metal translocating P-type ATPase|nr:cadmium-translocating P-type ATPase [Cellulomonadaceae bacterium]
MSQAAGFGVGAVGAVGAAPDSARRESFAARVLRNAKAYPFVTGTVLVGLLGLLLYFPLHHALANSANPVAFEPRSITRWLVLAWCAVIAVRLIISMIAELKAGNWGLDVLALVAIVSTALVGDYWASLVIALMISSGEALEDYADGRAKRDLTALMSNAPKVAHRVLPDGSAEDIAADTVKAGDTVIVRAHEVVPVDGILESEVGSFDESSLTGESLPRDLTQGDKVLSGSVCGGSAVMLTATDDASHSQYQQIVALVKEAAESRSPMVRLADRYAVPFTLVAFAIAGFAWWVSRDPRRFAEVLVVATPCPLLIAAPVAFMAGMSRAAKRGIIFRSSASLERIKDAKSFAFDKTGTLTIGAPKLVAVRPAGAPKLIAVRSASHLGEEQMLTLAASAEQGSTHILADAIVIGAKERGLALPTPSQVQETSGGGASALVEGHKVVVGKRAYLIEQIGVEPPAVELEPGQLSVLVGIDGQYAGYLILSDTLRPDAAETIAKLRAAGITNIAMFTGDEPATANFVAQQVGIEQVNASCLPADKLAGVRALPKPVVMVGDGVNDAPVLAAADVGIAMAARGSTAASESADIVILADSVSNVAETLKIGRQTVSVAMQSIWIGIVISVALMLFAATGRLPALAGAWLQEGVDAAAILWALRAGGRFLRA